MTSTDKKVSIVFLAIHEECRISFKKWIRLIRNNIRAASLRH
jgi:hypothetical protein